MRNNSRGMYACGGCADCGFGSAIRLAEFPDCGATATYFRLLDRSTAKPDTLFTGDAR